MYKPLLFLIAFLVVRLHGVYAQTRDSVYLRLQKRYNTATPWGNGYIVGANNYYGFANKKGELVLPFGCRCIDTLLPDRARICNDEHHRGSVLINADGIPVNSGHNHNLRLVNKARRIFAMDLGDNTELLANDSGRQLTYQGYDRNAPPGTMIATMLYTGSGYVYGIITIEGDTILPLIYHTVSVGKYLYAATRNDTGFVYSKGKGLLCTIAGVHECRVLQNDFIVVKKYGMSALVSRQGKLLTPFKYMDIKDFRHPYSIMPGNTQSKTRPPIVPQYAEINVGQPGGLIDATGREVLPMVYDNINMNLNGWFILRKVMHDGEELTDSGFKTILTADAYDLSFVNERYVTNTTSDVESDATKTRIYDMKLRKYVAKMDDASKKFPKGNGAASLPYTSDNTRIISDRNHPDSIIINKGMTGLYKRNGYWGVQSITGDTILPFVYDTAGMYSYHQFYVGRNGKYGVLDEEGNLAIPLLLPKIPWFVTADSLAMTTNKEAYSLKGGILTTLDINSEPVRRHLIKGNKPGLINYDNTSYGLKTGIYNNRLQLLSDRPWKNSNRKPAMNAFIAAVQDTTDKLVALMDSTGASITDWIPRPRDLKMYSTCALAIYDTGHADILFRFDSGKVSVDTVFVDDAAKYGLLYRMKVRGDYYQNFIEYGIQFVLPNTGRGMAMEEGGHCLLVPGADKIVADRSYTLLRANGKWALYNNKGAILLPPDYDSIAVDRENNFFLFRDKKVGVYDWATKAVTEPAYDTIYYTASLRNRFLIGHKGPTAEFMDEKGRVFSKGWKNVPGLMYSVIGGIPATRNWKKYKLYPSLTDSVEAIPDETLPEGVSITRPFMDGTAIVTKDKLYGVYDLQKKSWLIPPKYASVENQDDFFVASSWGDQPSVTIYTTGGLRLFSMKGKYYAEREPYFNQWYMKGTYGPPVVNNTGRIIVPDTFDKAFVISGAQRHLYQAITKKEMRAIFDSSGKMMTPAILDYIIEESWMYDGYFLGSLNGAACLLSPAGKMLTPCIYEELYAADVKPRHAGRSSGILVLPYVKEHVPPYFIGVDKKTGKFGVIDSTGKSTVPCVYDSILQVYEGVVVVKKGDKWGLADLKNKPIADIKYDRIDIFYGGTASFRRGEILGVLNREGVETIVR